MPETNPILQSLYARKSVRVFEEKAIPAGMKQAILEAAAQAPSAGCQQLYTILDITDPALKAALADSCDHQPFIAKAPLVLVFCADCRKWYDAYKEAGCTPRTPGVGDLMLAVTDTAIAAQNAVVAAESFGIGSCYIGDIMENCDTQRSLLHLPAAHGQSREAALLRQRGKAAAHLQPQRTGSVRPPLEGRRSGGHDHDPVRPDPRRRCPQIVQVAVVGRVEAAAVQQDFHFSRSA